MLPAPDGAGGVCRSKVSTYCVRTHNHTNAHIIILFYFFTFPPFFLLQVCEQTGSGVSVLCGSLHHGNLCRSHKDRHPATRGYVSTYGLIISTNMFLGLRGFFKRRPNANLNSQGAWYWWGWSGLLLCSLKTQFVRSELLIQIYVN